MSIMHCHKHDQQYDSDFGECPECDSPDELIASLMNGAITTYYHLLDGPNEYIGVKAEETTGTIREGETPGGKIADGTYDY